MKFLIIYVAIFLATLQSHAQNDLVRYRLCNSGCTSSTTKNDPLDGQFNYGNITTFETKDVVSDYGIRNVNKGSKFHKGIDYSTEQNNNDKGNAIVAIKSGTISSISGNLAYKYISIGNYRYGHIFMTAIPIGENYQKVGKFILKTSP